MYQVEALRISQSRLAGRCGTTEPVHLAVYTSVRQNTRRAWKELLKSQCSLATHRYLRCKATWLSFICDILLAPTNLVLREHHLRLPAEKVPALPLVQVCPVLLILPADKFEDVAVRDQIQLSV